MKNYDYCIFIGRCQPYTLAHEQLLKEAFLLGDQVICVLGSHNKAPDSRDPWTSQLREGMIRNCLSEEENKRISFIYMHDYLYNENLWVTELQQKIEEQTVGSSSVAMVGYEQSGSYLHNFPQWDWQKKGYGAPHDLSAEVRKLYFSGSDEWKKHVPTGTIEYLEAFKKDKYFLLKEEFDIISSYKKAWGNAPFPPTFNTVDTVCIKSGHVLVVRRKGMPGRGLIALPGGFLNQNEFIIAGAIRELKEETKIKVSKEELEKSIIDQKVFDYPYRSLRGRTITHAFLINLGKGPLPKVQGDDDADKAWWMPLNEFYTRESDFFEDHWHIINHFVNKF